MRGPLCEHWPLTHVAADLADGTIYATGGNAWFGPAVWKSNDGGTTWTHSSQGLAYPQGETPVQCAWVALMPRTGGCTRRRRAGETFVSGDGGESFREVEGLRRHPSRPQWQPGGIGLVLHSIVSDPTDVRRLWVGISSVGVFYTEDGGETWSPRNSGTRCRFSARGERYPEFGQCVHNLTLAPGCSDRLYQQNHCVHVPQRRRRRVPWRSIENGLPSSFGFPVAAHPRDADTLFFQLPLNGDTKGRYPPDARVAVWRSRDGGAHWADGRAGLPQSGAYFGVMRQALATDALDPAGVYFGTSNGSVYASRDEGETWECIARDLPAISSVETMTAA